MGIVYLLHFDQRLGRSRHYLGYTTTLERRLKDHRLGRGGKTTARFRAAGIGFELAAQWPGSPDDEQRLKAKNLALLCPVCREEKMTVLEALQQAADVATRKATLSLTDLVKLTKASRSRVRQELKALLDEGKITVVSKGDAGQNKTVYQLALCVPVRPAVREDYVQHSSAQPNRTVEQDTTRFADSIELGTVSAHSAASTVPVDDSAAPNGSAGAGGPAANLQISPTTSMPPVLLFFREIERMGRCLDATRHYIADLEIINLGLRYPVWAAERFYEGTVTVFHIPYRDSRIVDIFHALLFFPGGKVCDRCKPTGPPSSLCRPHLLLHHVRGAFPTAVAAYSQHGGINQYVEALYDVRRFCTYCAGTSLPGGLFPGFEYVPNELSAVTSAGTGKGDAGCARSAPAEQGSASADGTVEVSGRLSQGQLNSDAGPADKPGTAATRSGPEGKE
jgi:predicted GIY-YIG superfamily endonuclease